MAGENHEIWHTFGTATCAKKQRPCKALNISDLQERQKVSGEGGILCRGPFQLIISLCMRIIPVYNGITCNVSHILKAL